MTATTVNDNGQNEANGNDNANEQFITSDEVSKRLNRSTRTIRSWMRQGKLPYYQIGRTVRFDWHEVKTHLGRNCRVDHGTQKG